MNAVNKIKVCAVCGFVQQSLGFNATDDLFALFRSSFFFTLCKNFSGNIPSLKQTLCEWSGESSLVWLFVFQLVSNRSSSLTRTEENWLLQLTGIKQWFKHFSFKAVWTIWDISTQKDRRRLSFFFNFQKKLHPLRDQQICEKEHAWCKFLQRTVLEKIATQGYFRLDFRLLLMLLVFHFLLIKNCTVCWICTSSSWNNNKK